MLASISAPTSTLNLPQKVTVPNIEASEPKRIVEKRKHSRIINLIKKSVGAITIIKGIINLGLNLTISELLTLSPVVEKQFTNAITEDKVMQFWVNTLEFHIVNTQNSHS